MMYIRFFTILKQFLLFLIFSAFFSALSLLIFFKMGKEGFSHLLALAFNLVIAVFIERIIIEKDKHYGFFFFLKQQGTSFFFYLFPLVILSQALILPIYFILFIFSGHLYISFLLFPLINAVFFISSLKKYTILFLLPLLFIYFKAALI